VLTTPNLQRARALAEAWDDHADICRTDELPVPRKVA